MRPDDIALLRVPGSLTLRGELLLADVARPDLADDAYRGGLVRVPLDGSAARPWTHGDRDSAPRISPDGQWVAFLRSADGPPQLYVMPAAGGEPKRITDLPGGAGKPVWAPDSVRIAFAARVPEAGRYNGTPEAEAPRRITRLDYRIDDIGFIADRPQQLFVAHIVSGVEQLTHGDRDVHLPAWTSDGERVIVVARRDPDNLFDVYEDFFAVSATGGDLVPVLRTRGEIGAVTVHEDRIFYLGTRFTGTSAEPRNRGLWTARLDLGEPRLLTDPETVDCETAAGAPIVSGDGVLVGIRNRGAVELRRVPLDADGVVLADLPLVLGEKALATSFAEHDGRIAAVLSTQDSPGEVVVVGRGTVTDFNAELRAAGVLPLRELTTTAPDGYPVHGWVMLPKGEGPHPVILSVHGGPFMYYGWGFFDEAQVYAAAGYAVVMTNPRGSAGYGQAHGTAIVGGLGTVDADDVLALLDAALTLPECDADRVGVMGGSYGGFMTSWLAAHHGDRFRAAWSERAVNAWDSFVGSSDIGWWFAEVYCGPDPEAQRAASPLTYAEKIRIPFAVVHSEQDWRCPLEQAQRMFVALKRNGVDAELLVFPGEGHELTRSGRPMHRKQRFDAVLTWWNRHLH